MLKIIVGILLLLLLLCWFLFKKQEKYPIIENKFKYKGIVLFDIDGTLTTGFENEKVVQYFIDRNYVVGISTAGSMYHPDNLLNFSWMPKNLYYWMEKHNFDTFNNVMSGILCGEYNPEAFNDNIRRNDLDIYNMLGWRKGLTLEMTAKKYGISNPKEMFLLDNDPSYLRGLSLYNPYFNLICAGKPCSKYHMGMHSILPYIEYN